MTADPKARRLATEFFGQWLGFYHFDQYRGVDTGRFPEFTDEVQVRDVRRSRLHLRVHRAGRQRPVKEILYADYTFLNKPLAKFYGVEKEVQKKVEQDVEVGRSGGDGARARTRSTAAARCAWARS